ncbi:hypothetical protein [Aeromonas caviae]|uniref:hypothetical protein n=1 Tax=Aeromonas caviae TaxID=648 RepID=UPI002B4AAD3C|nr:hypothetical protein [Aeromonas caviae]
MTQSVTIKIKGQLHNIWIYATYSFVISLLIKCSEDSKEVFEHLSTIFFEPISINVFLILSTVGFSLVCIRAMTLGMDEKKTSKCWFMKHICIPISEAGLSAATAILGVLLGVCLFSVSIEYGTENTDRLIHTVIKSILLILFIVVPMIWMQKIIFSTTKTEKIILQLVIFIYIAICYTVLYVNNEIGFYKLVLITITILTLAFCFSYYLNAKARKTANKY